MADFGFSLSQQAPVSFVLTGLDTELTIGELSADVIFELGAFFKGDKGDKGDAGDAGPGAGPIATLTGVAASALGGHRAVGPNHAGDYTYVGNDIAIDAFRAIGVTTGAASSGAACSVQTYGPIVEPSWAWTADLPVFLGTNGGLTQTVPTSAGGASFILIIGVALTATSIFVRPSPPIYL